LLDISTDPPDTSWFFNKAAYISYFQFDPGDPEHFFLCNGSTIQERRSSDFSTIKYFDLPGGVFHSYDFNTDRFVYSHNGKITIRQWSDGQIVKEIPCWAAYPSPFTLSGKYMLNIDNIEADITLW
jgi:hypothetical protein